MNKNHFTGAGLLLAAVLCTPMTLAAEGDWPHYGGIWAPQNIPRLTRLMPAMSPG